MEFLSSLLSFSEKAGDIARTIRREPKLFSLLVEEKGEGEKNQRFAHDFKTLADVLIQEALRHHVAQTFPALGEHVQGEESAEFTNTLGEKITVRVCPAQHDTKTLLAKVLDGNTDAAELLAQVVHKVVTREPEPHLAPHLPHLPLDDLGIWIDPIDSTGEYVKGDAGRTEGGVYSSGLPSVTILIGFFQRSSGIVLGGVLNHPFKQWDEESQRWQGKVYWGVSHDGRQVHNIPPSTAASDTSKGVVVVSGSEDVGLQGRLARVFEVVHASGAGYKLLTVVLGLARAYVCSKGSTFRWDTAAPHGILRALGGGVADYRSLVAKEGDVCDEVLAEVQVRYSRPNEGCSGWCNDGGVLAYADPAVLPPLLRAIRGD